MSRILAVSRRTFSALSSPNFRRYFFGQSTSLVGTWMQSVAQSWLVFTLTHSATAIGFVLALQTLPVLILGPYGGVIADRVDKRRLMIALQTLMGIQALVLGLLVVMHVVTFWEICVLAVVLGLNNCFENPARQAFVREMVGAGEVRNAVSLNSTMVNAARAVGPAVAGLLIATVGVGVCFLVNAVSFIAVVYSLVSMDTKALTPSAPTARARGPAARGIPLRGTHTQAGSPAAHDGDCRHPRLRVPGDPAGPRQSDLRRQRGDVWVSHLGDGDWRSRRWPSHRNPRTHGPAPARRLPPARSALRCSALPFHRCWPSRLSRWLRWGGPA